MDNSEIRERLNVQIRMRFGHEVYDSAVMTDRAGLTALAGRIKEFGNGVLIGLALAGEIQHGEVTGVGLIKGGVDFTMSITANAEVESFSIHGVKHGRLVVDEVFTGHSDMDVEMYGPIPEDEEAD